MASLIPELPHNEQLAIDADLVKRAGDDATRYLLRWALDSGHVATAMAFFPAVGRIDELTRAVNALLESLGPKRSYARYRTAILRLGYIRREVHLEPLSD